MMTTVGELIELLKNEDPKRVVVLRYGDEYTPLFFMWTGAYRAESTWAGKMGLETLTDKDRKIGYTEKDVFKDGVPALALNGVH
jgi:hypothetical protein